MSQIKKNNFPNNLILLRKKYNLSQEELGKKINVSKQTISKYEKGLVEPNFYTLICISKFFNCNLDDLVFGNVEISKKNTIDLILLIENKLDHFLKSEIESLKNEIESLKNDTKTLILSYLEDNLQTASIKNKSNFNLKNSNVTEEFSEELSPLNEKTTNSNINKIINLDKHKLKNSIDIDFYKNNNLKICDSLNSNFAYSNQAQLEYISVYGNISCGLLKYTNGSIEDYFYLHKNDLKYDKSDYFILQIDGESMNKLYKNGDYILIHKNKNYEGYKPYVFILDDEATLKYIDLDLENRTIILVPHSTDSSYQKQILKFEDLNSTNFGILGTVEGVLNFID